MRAMFDQDQDRTTDLAESIVKIEFKHDMVKNDRLT